MNPNYPTDRDIERLADLLEEMAADTEKPVMWGNDRWGWNL